MKENSSTRVGQMRIAWSVIGVCYIIVWIAPFLTDLSGQAFGSAENLANMRDSSQFGWHVIALLGVIVEIILNSFDALIWNYWWWSTRFPFFLLILAYFPFALITYFVYDLPSTKQQASFVGSMAGGLAVC